MDLLSGAQALMGAVLIVPGIFFILHSKKNGAFVFKAGRSGVEVTGANTGMFLLLMGVILLFLCRFNYEKAGDFKILETQKQVAATQLQLSQVSVDSLGAAYAKLDRRFKLAKDNKAIVPDLSGLTKEQAIAVLTESGLAAGPVGIVNPDRAITGPVNRGIRNPGHTASLLPNMVVEQKVKSGQVVDLKTRIAFKVAGGD